MESKSKFNNSTIKGFLKNHIINSVPYKNFKFTDYEVEGRKGISVFMLYDERCNNEDGPSAAIVRYASGAVTPTHLHPGWELVLVLDSELIDDRGCGVLQTFPSGSKCSLSSVKGCTYRFWPVVVCTAN